MNFFYELDTTRGYFRPFPRRYPQFVISNEVRCITDALGIDWAVEVIAEHQEHPRIRNDEKLKGFHCWQLQFVRFGVSLELRPDENAPPVYSMSFHHIHEGYTMDYSLFVSETSGGSENDHKMFQYCRFPHCPLAILEKTYDDPNAVSSRS